MSTADRTTPAEAAIRADLGRPWARKSGRNPKFPYVPVVLIADDLGHERQAQVIGYAFATRTEAEGLAARHIDKQRLMLLRKLEQPCYRALRAMYGVVA